MKLRLLRDGAWLGMNGVVAALFLSQSSRQWIEPGLREVPGASGGGPLVFNILVLELLGPLLLLNLIWLAWTIRAAARDRDLTPLWVFGLMGVAWVAMILISASKLGS